MAFFPDFRCYNGKKSHENSSNLGMGLEGIKMEYTNFEQIMERVKTSSLPKRMAVAQAADPHSIEAALEGRRTGMAHPILVGDKSKILSLLQELGETVDDIYDEADPAAACKLAVSLIREGKADFLMKGNVDTSILMKAVIDKSTGLMKGGLLSHFALFQVSGYHKLLSVVDAGVVPYPTLEQKRGIIENAVQAMRSIGYECPRVAVLACIEKVNPKMPETVEAAELQRMNLSGEIQNCLINGPVSYDCAISSSIAEIKGYTGTVSGDVDILSVPNIHAGNILVKALVCTGGAKMAGTVLGAACPIVLASRGSSAEEKFLSIVLSSAVSGSA